MTTLGRGRRPVGSWAIQFSKVIGPLSLFTLVGCRLPPASSRETPSSLGARRTPWNCSACISATLTLLISVATFSSNVIALAGQGGQFRLVSVVSGSKGEQSGDQYKIDDPRSAFRVPADKQVLVYFTWEGPLGQHHLQAVWKNPDGKAVLLSDMIYESKEPRFGAYFGLALDPSIAPGIWRVEATVDGQPVGSESFQVESDAAPPSTPAQPLPEGEIYKLGVAATVTLQKLDPEGQRFASASAFFVGKDLLATSFGGIDGASKALAVLSNGTSVSVEGVVGWNRREDWALLRVEPQEVQPLEFAKPNSWQVGDNCYSLDVAGEGNRTILAGNITGTSHLRDIGDRLNVIFPTAMARGATGAPLLNDYGKVIGIALSGGLLPGSNALDDEAGAHHLFGAGYDPSGPADKPLRGPVAVPASLIQIPPLGAKTTTFQDLANASQFAPVLRFSSSMWRGFVAEGVQPNGEMPLPIGEKYEFTHQERKAVVLVEWDAIKGLRTQASMRLYDLDNRPAGSGKTVKVSAAAGHKSGAVWTLDLSGLPTGVYRVDVLAGAEVVWRAFFRLND